MAARGCDGAGEEEAMKIKWACPECGATTGPLSVQCNPCRAAIGVPCTADGTCCANRITRALFIGAGVADERAREATPSARACETTRGEPGKAAPLVVEEDVAARGRS